MEPGHDLRSTYVIFTWRHLCHVRIVRRLPQQLLTAVQLQLRLGVATECAVGVVGIVAAAAAAGYYLRVAALDKVDSA